MEQMAFGLTYAVPAFGAAISIAVIGYSAMNAAGRNPEKINDIRTLMITAIVFADSLAIIALIVAIVGKLL
ncbi:H(+)-transporting ATPase [Candidatus Saccharibacteria bacterium HGW-Saccharibacteria-1]|jgi:F0F1-type ATP synthase membrane subunit c/vacuolar-type H+-ATPase subunit K|nr:MAG: H(+)-transporting ATPase [Candidatus Saccharibacteria bacterium HGW-Saccharibacteria-1]